MVYVIVHCHFISSMLLVLCYSILHYNTLYCMMGGVVRDIPPPSCDRCERHIMCDITLLRNGVSILSHPRGPELFGSLMDNHLVLLST